MLTELRNRGLRDALIVCCDGLKGLPDSIRLTWPEAVVQTRVVHMVRNSLRYASRKHWKQITRQMREIYTAPTVEAAEAHFAAFKADWNETYPAMINAWENAWPEFVPFLEYPLDLRTLVYTTNSIESLNARFRRAVRHRGHFPTEQAAVKVLYLVATTQRKNRQGPQRTHRHLEKYPQHPTRPLRRPHRSRRKLETNQPYLHNKSDSPSRGSLPTLSLGRREKSEPHPGQNPYPGVAATPKECSLGRKGANGIHRCTLDPSVVAVRGSGHWWRRAATAE